MTELRRVLPKSVGLKGMVVFSYFLVPFVHFFFDFVYLYPFCLFEQDNKVQYNTTICAHITHTHIRTKYTVFVNVSFLDSLNGYKDFE